MSRATRWRLPILAVTLGLILSGCTSWRQAYPGTMTSPGDVVLATSPDDVRLLRQRGVEIELHRPEVVGDSIVGEARRFGFGRVAIPISDIRRLDVRVGDSPRSAGAVILALPASMLGIVLVLCLFNGGQCS